MANGRMIRRKIALSKALAQLPSDRARLLFTWCIPFLDVAGRMPGDPDVVKAMVVPMLTTHTPETVAEDIAACAALGLVQAYKAGGELYLHFPGFLKNQNLQPDREAKSTIPPPPEGSSPVTPDYSGVTPEDSGATPEESLLREEKLKRSSSEEKSSLPRRRPFSEDHMVLAQRLRDRILAHKPDCKVPSDLSAWADEMRLMVEQDHRGLDRIAAVIDWATSDTFWRANILSARKLREKFDTLVMQMERKVEVGGTNGHKPSETADRYAGVRARAANAV